jgi:hypothetical protein
MHAEKILKKLCKEFPSLLPHHDPIWSTWIDKNEKLHSVISLRLGEGQLDIVVEPTSSFDTITRKELSELAYRVCEDAMKLFRDKRAANPAALCTSSYFWVEEEDGAYTHQEVLRSVEFKDSTAEMIANDTAKRLANYTPDSYEYVYTKLGVAYKFWIAVHRLRRRLTGLTKSLFILNINPNDKSGFNIRTATIHSIGDGKVWGAFLVDLLEKDKIIQFIRSRLNF